MRIWSNVKYSRQHRDREAEQVSNHECEIIFGCSTWCNCHCVHWASCKDIFLSTLLFYCYDRDTPEGEVPNGVHKPIDLNLICIWVIMTLKNKFWGVKWYTLCINFSFKFMKWPTTDLDHKTCVWIVFAPTRKFKIRKKCWNRQNVLDNQKEQIPL